MKSRRYSGSRGTPPVISGGGGGGLASGTPSQNFFKRKQIEELIVAVIHLTPRQTLKCIGLKEWEQVEIFRNGIGRLPK
jgi:hypothetical protein